MKTQRVSSSSKAYSNRLHFSCFFCVLKTSPRLRVECFELDQDKVMVKLLKQVKDQAYHCGRDDYYAEGYRNGHDIEGIR